MLTPNAIPAKQGGLSITPAHTPVSLGFGLLLLFAMLATSRIQEAVPTLAALRVVFVTGALAAFAWVLAPASLQEKIRMENRSVRLVLVILALAVMTIPIGVWPAHSLAGAVSYAKTVLLFLMTYFWCKTLADIRRVIWVCCIGTVGLVLFSLVGGGLNRYSTSSQSYDANDIAFLLVMLIPLVVYLISTSGGKIKLMLGGMMMVCLYGIMRTQSRGGFLALLAVGGMILLRSKLPLLTKAGLASVSLFVFLGLADNAFWDRMGTIWAPESEYDRTAGGRTEIWKTGIQLMATHPWGIGIDGFDIAEGLTHGGEGKWSAAHNSFIQIGVELGIVGLILFTLLLAKTIRDLRRLQRLTTQSSHQGSRASLGRNLDRRGQGPRDHLFMLATALEVALWGFCVGGFFLSQAYNALLYVLIALSLACSRLAEASARTDERGSQGSLWPAQTSSPCGQPARGTPA